MNTKKKRVLVGAVGILVVATASLAVIALPGGAEATAKSEVRPFSAVVLPSDVRGALSRSAAREDVKTGDIREVAARGEGKARAGMYVGQNSHGLERVSFFGPQAFTTFAKPELLAPAERPLYVSTGAQPEIAGGPTRHVQLAGVARSTRRTDGHRGWSRLSKVPIFSVFRVPRVPGFRT